ncbi:MAG: SLBB domain-containing protein, partial [Chloroflexota bacterium]
MKNVLYTLVGVMAGFALAGLLLFISRAPAGEPIKLLPAPTKEPIAVHIIGAVPRPGLYEFAEGARVQDAIDAAGGLLSSANIDSINLAALL